MDSNYSDESRQDFSIDFDSKNVVTPPKRQRISRPKVCDSSFWSNENIKKLIRSIKIHPAIWQTDSEGFKSRTQREEAWQKVAESFDEDPNIDLNQLVAKWQNLRTQYRAARVVAKKYVEQQIGRKPAWRFYNEMSFIDMNELVVMQENGEANSTVCIPEQLTSTLYIKHTRKRNRKVVNSAFWNDQNVLKLINAVKKRKSIWNFNDENYKNRAIREADWLAVDNEFKQAIPVNQLAAKWQNLRTSYRSVKNTTKKFGKRRIPNWKFYDYMTFLDAGDEEETEKAQIVYMENIQALEEIESLDNLDEYVKQEVRNENSLIQSDYEDNSVKEEDYDEKNEDGSFCDPLQKTEDDSIEVFGNFFVSELRKIKNQAYLEATQRKILQFLWRCIDEEPISSKN